MTSPEGLPSCGKCKPLIYFSSASRHVAGVPSQLEVESRVRKSKAEEKRHSVHHEIQAKDATAGLEEQTVIRLNVLMSMTLEKLYAGSKN